jgi:hypothetical protein
MESKSEQKPITPAAYEWQSNKSKQSALAVGHQSVSREI